MNFPSPSRLKRALSSSSDQRINQTLASHGSAILALFVFLVLVSFGFALWMLKMWIVQEQLRLAVGEVYVMQQGQPQSETSEFIRSPISSRNPGIVMESIPCSGALQDECGDAMIRQDAGVYVRSVRSLMNGLGYDRLAYPEALLGPRRYLVMRLENPEDPRDANNPPEIRDHVIVLDLETRKVTDIKTPVPPGAFYSTGEAPSAAYIKAGNGDYREVVVVDLLKDVAETVAKAKRSEMFWNGATPPKVKQFDGKSLVFEVYTSSDATHTLPTLQETRTVEIGK